MASSKHEVIELIADFLAQNNLHATAHALRTERGSAAASSPLVECALTQLLSSTKSIFDNTERSDGALSTETQVVAFNAAKGDPHGSAVLPLYQTATFAQPSATAFGAYDYTRSGNPTRDAAQALLAQVDNAKYAFCYSTGMAAVAAVTRFAEAGHEVVLSDDSYGGTYRLLAQVANRMGVKTTYVDLSGPGGPSRLKAAMTPRTKLVMCESPTNPMMRICDLRALAATTHATTPGALFSVDNTLMTGLLMRPLDLGADVVITSCTKFACGHSDTMAGVVSCNDEVLAKQLYFTQNAEGTGLAPFDCWLLLRGLKTMPLRLERAMASALSVAKALQTHPRVTQVFYAGLRDHDGYATHCKQSRGAGVVVCFTTGNYHLSTAVASACAASGLFKITVSFGSVNSLVSLPGDMSHASIPDDVKSDRAFPTDMVRLSIGIESPSDLIRVLLDSLTKASPNPPPPVAVAKL